MVGTRSRKNINVASVNKTIINSKTEFSGLNVMIKQVSELSNERRDDFDYYEPTTELMDFSRILLPLDEVLEFSGEHRDPSEDGNANFKYVEISSINTDTGKIVAWATIPCIREFVPSRARKVIHEDDIVISTVRPTRKAISKVPKSLENEICSTGFAVVRPKLGINIDYLLYILRTPLVGKQFGKFASGSSYPAILEKHIRMTKIPVPDKHIQKNIAQKMNRTASRVELLHDKTQKIVERSNVECDKMLRSSAKC